MSQVKNRFVFKFHSKGAGFLLVVFLHLSCFKSNAQENDKTTLLQKIRITEQETGFSTTDTLYIDLLNRLAVSKRFYNTDSLLLIANKALTHSKDANYPLGECKALLSLGDYHSDKGASKEAIAHYQSAHTIAKSLENHSLNISTQNNLAGEYTYQGDYANALNVYLEALELAEEHEDNTMRSIITENIANLYASQKDYEQALFFYKQVKKINEQLKDPISSAQTFANMGSIYADMGKLEYAMFNANSSIAIFEKEALTDWLAYAYEVKGKIYLKQKKFDWALFWYNQGELLHKTLEDDRGEIDLLNGIAETYLGLKKDSISQQYAIRAFEISTRINFTEGRQKCAKTLYKISKNNKDYATALEYHELFQQLSDTISQVENQKSLALLKTKSEYEHQKTELILENEKELATQRNYVNLALAILLIFIIVTFLVHRSEKVLKTLNEELKVKTTHLEKNEVELKKINETKNKLFSIVAHDLRGPIGAFQGLLNLLRDGEIKNDEFMGFIPKLGHDIDHISFTLNNLLSWGQAQMNGLITKPSIISIDTIVSENIHLLSETATNKSIKLASQLPENTMAWTDGDQIDIVIRNLISNAIKFTPKNGMVTVGALEKTDYWEISVRDTGIGMDQETIDKVFEENSNITTYGTDNEKGTGLGLSLCKEMVEKNNGTIWVDSLPQRGSCFYFTVPKAKKQYKRTG